MNLNEYEDIDIEFEDDEEDAREQNPVSKKNGGPKKGLFIALLATAIAILVVLILMILCLVYAYRNGNIVYTSNTEINTETEKPIYTENQMQEMLEKAEDDAQAQKNIEVSAAEEEGYQLGKLDLLNFIKDTLLTNNSSIETFRLLYPDYLVVVSKGAYHFLPIDKSLRLSKLVESQINVLPNGEIEYLDENGNVSSYKGIDVSQYQGDIKWDKVADDGVDFAFVRVLCRGYGSGKLVMDDKAEKNLKGAIDNGIHVGAYVFSQAINVEEAVEEAQEAIAVVSEYATNVPIVIDVERVAGANPRMDALSVEERTDVILAFCETVEKAGFKPMIYFNTEMGALYVDNARLDAIPKWYAWYATSLYFPYEYDIWQYKDSGSVSGIKGNVDMNIALKPFWE